MEPLPTEEMTPGRRPRGRCLLFMPLFLLTGCVTTESFLDKETAPTGAPCHVLVNWKKQVYFTPDPARGGEPMPGLVGRMFLFDKKVGYPIAGNGAVVVDLYDATGLASGRPPVRLEQWYFDKDTLARLLHKDGIGWGYTLFLPWGGYRPDLRHLQFRMRFEPEGGSPLYGEITQVVLQEENKPVFSSYQTTTPTAAPPPTTPAPVAPRTAEAPRMTEAPRSQSFNLARKPE